MSWLGSGRWQKQLGISLDQPSVYSSLQNLSLKFHCWIPQFHNIGQSQERVEQSVEILHLCEDEMMHVSNQERQTPMLMDALQKCTYVC